MLLNPQTKLVTPTFKNEAMICPQILKPSPKQFPFLNLRPIICCSTLHHNNNPNTTNRSIIGPKTHLTKTLAVDPNQDSISRSMRRRRRRSKGDDEKADFSQVGSKQMLVLCGFGYWVQGFRCFPWLALNYHMAHNLNFNPSMLQLVQYSGNLPMVAKPLYGIFSDTFYIGGAHRIPYVTMGVFLQVLSWGPLALIPVAGEALPTLMSCVLLSNLGASVAEVANDALIAEYGQMHKIGSLQSYAFMALAMGGMLGNLVGGYFLLKVPPRTMFRIFSVLLSFQLAISSTIRESSLGLPQPLECDVVRNSILEGIRKQLIDLVTAISEESISRPLAWIVASIAVVPILSGSIFCYQTQCLQLDPSIIGMSRVIGQLVLLSTTVLYDRYWKKLPMRKLIGAVQILYASSLLLDFILVKQINLKLGIPNKLFALCFSGLAETVAQFKLLPFTVLFARLCPPGCEGSLISFLASALCLASLVSGFLGIGLGSLLGITSSDYLSLPVGIAVQFVAALVPLLWIYHVPASQPFSEMERKKGMSRRSRKNRRIGRVVLGSVIAYRRERESETQM